MKTFQTYFQQGKQERQNADDLAAIHSFRKAIELKDDFVPAYNNLANALQTVGKLDEACAVYEKALVIAPNVAVLHCNLASLWQLKNESEKAIVGYKKAITLKSDFFLAHFNLGKLLAQQKKYQQAITHYQDALHIQPYSVDAYLEYGAILCKINRFLQALKCFESALDIEPKCAKAYLYAGVTLIESKQYHLALLCCNRALALDVFNSEVAFYNKSLALSRLNQFQEAIIENEKAIAIKPDYPDAHWNSSLCHLMLGDYVKGWREYEWRWQRTGANPENLRKFDQPLWLGKENLHGKTILIHAEQGMGDTIQFCRYIEKVSALGACVIFEVYSGLKSLFQHFPVTLLIERGDLLPDFDYHCPLLSLPLALDIAIAPPCRLSILDNKVEYWQQILGEKTQPRIGLVWSGNPSHQNDNDRSIALMKWMPVLAVPVQFISLQKELRDKNTQTLLQQHQIYHYGEQLHDFGDTAALIKQLDLVIAVDTAVAHLAAAIGKPVWLLLHYNPDWRWQLERSDSPWYPNVRLFRQCMRDNWQEVMIRVAQALNDYFKQPLTTKKSD